MSLNHLMASLSFCLDFVSQGLDRHHQRVTFTSLVLAEALGLTNADKAAVFTAGIVHDAGVSSWREKSTLKQFDVDTPWDHCQRGFDLLRGTSLLAPVAEIVLCHHDRWAADNRSGKSGRDIPLAARIIHLADRVDVLLEPSIYVLYQRENILAAIARLAGRVFDPDLVSLLTEVSSRESFWLDLTSPFLLRRLSEYPLPSLAPTNSQVLLDLSNLFAGIIDAKSPFTHRHSRGVAQAAETLAADMGFSVEEQARVRVAGLLHDLGKLSVPDEILEKPGPLTPAEFAVIRQHTYYTYHILREAGSPDPIPAWAAYHHEKLNGSGYPFHLDASQLSPGARLMAVADTFTALREDRPYRPGMPRPQIEKIMEEQVESGAFDPTVVDVLLANYRHLEELWATLQ
ncbi:MAG: HD domain-containing protein [Clostridia bacterium]|nr:MAG: HD domain-containing protein [Clostridia bacterium]